MKRLVLLCLAMSAAAAAVAQSATPLDLSVPEQTVAPAATAPEQGDPPGTYYGDTSGKPSSRNNPGIEVADDGKAKVWGSFTTGIGHTKGYGTSHYNAAEVNVSKSFGDGERPNEMNLQIRVEQTDGPGFGGRYPYPYYDHDRVYPPPR